MVVVEQKGFGLKRELMEPIGWKEIAPVELPHQGLLQLGPQSAESDAENTWSFRTFLPNKGKI